MKFDYNTLRTGKDVFVIAEIGKNFIQSEAEASLEVYLENAKELVRLAKESGADAVKFQTHNVEDEQLDLDVTSPHFTASDRYSWVRRNTEATPLSFWEEIKAFADAEGILFFTTPMSRGAAQRLETIELPLWKVGSGDILDFVTLEYLAQTNKPILVSSGMSSIDEVDRVVAFLKERTEQVALLHCVSKYPCPPEELNLNTIDYFKERYDLPIGFSDHSLGHDSVLSAVEKGAVVIEKHFSTSREHWGSDHKVSMLPDEFAQMVADIRVGKSGSITEFGEKGKVMHDGESVFRPYFRKSLMFARDVQAGETVDASMVYAMRPQAHAGGLPSEAYEAVIGKKLKQGVSKYAPITKDILGS